MCVAVKKTSICLIVNRIQVRLEIKFCYVKLGCKHHIFMILIFNACCQIVISIANTSEFDGHLTLICKKKKYNASLHSF